MSAIGKCLVGAFTGTFRALLQNSLSTSTERAEGRDCKERMEIRIDNQKGQLQVCVDMTRLGTSLTNRHNLLIISPDKFFNTPCSCLGLKKVASNKFLVLAGPEILIFLVHVD